MTIGELRRVIADLPTDTEIWLSRDPEGNGYSKVGEYDNNCIPYNDGEEMLELGSDDFDDETHITHDFTKQEWTEIKMTHNRVLCLWPSL